MTDEVSGKAGKPGWLPFDLLGHPVPANKGQRGRPQHAATAENLEKIILLYGMGKTDAECAAAIGVSIDTMKTHYFVSAELQNVRRNAKAFLEGELLVRLNHQSLAGKVAATEKLLKRFDKSLLGPAPSTKMKPKKRKGVKEERKDQAWDAGREDRGWGPLIGPDTRTH